MTDPTPFDNLDSDQLWPLDRDVPDARDNLPDDFWSRTVRNVDTQGRT